MNERCKRLGYLRAGNTKGVWKSLDAKNNFGLLVIHKIYDELEYFFYCKRAFYVSYFSMVAILTLSYSTDKSTSLRYSHDFNS